MPDGKRHERWEPHEDSNPKQFEMYNRMKLLCGGLDKRYTTLVQFSSKSDPMKQEGLIRLHDFTALVATIENNGTWYRVWELGAHVAKKHVLIGGGSFDPLSHEVEVGDDKAKTGLDGWWKTPQGDYYLREDLPANYAAAAIPEGHMRDVAVKAKFLMSLFNRKVQARSNVAMTRRLEGLLHAASNVDIATQLRAPVFFVAAGSKPVFVRALTAEHSVEDIRRMDELSSENIILGSWLIPERRPAMTFSRLPEGVVATVKQVTMDHVSVEYDGHVMSSPNPVANIRQFIRLRAGMDASELDTVPLVEPGQQVSRHTCLWGPQRSQSISAASLRARSDRYANLIGIWSVLATGTEYAGQTLYNVAHVAPRSDARVYAGLFDEDGLPCGTQRIRANGVGAVGALLSTKRRLPGVRINLRNTSRHAWIARGNDIRNERRRREHDDAK